MLSVVFGGAAFRRLHAQMLICQPGRTASARRAGQKAHLHQVRLAQVFQRDGFLAESRRQRFQTHRAAVVHLNDRAEQAAVQLVQTQGVHVHPLQAQQGHIPVNDAVAQHRGKVADALEEAVCHAGRAAAALGQLIGAFRRDGLIQNACRPLDDVGKLVRAVKLQLEQHTEAVPQRAGDLSGTGGGAHQRKARQVDADALGAGAFADHDVQRVVFQRRIQHLFHLPGQAVDLIDEQHIALLQIGEQGGKVTGLLDGRAAGDADLHPHLVGDDAGQGGLAQARRAVEQDVVHRFAAPLGGFQINFQVLFDFFLSDVVLQMLRAKAVFFVVRRR